VSSKRNIPETVSAILKSIPTEPGVYQYFDSDGKILYVGKAKNLKKRVLSYFNKDLSASGKLKLLVKKIANIRFIVVQSETDALLLENNLIKEYLPRYNVMLKDDKTYPWICVKNEPFPRVFSTRHVVRDGSVYFGPYASVRMMYTLLDLIRQLYPIRNCQLILSEKNIKLRKFKVCLEYHIGNCKGPCEALQQEEEYNQNISQIKEIIQGNISHILSQTKALMHSYAEAMDFEKAQVVKEKLEHLEKYQSKSTIVNPEISNVDVFSIIDDEDIAYVNFLKVVQGAIIQSHTVELQKKLDETTDEILLYTITELRERFQTNTNEIIVPFDVSIKLPGLKYTIPKRGDKKQLLDLSERNAKYYRLEKEKQKELVDPERHSRRIMDRMMKDLRMQEQPAYIECFDNSNTQGAFPVSAMVVFRDGRPSKKEYRHYNIKTVEGPNDYASMEEVINRRYTRLVAENSPLPQLVVIDGGKGQLSSAVKEIEKLGLRGKITIIGIAKKLEEIYFPGDSVPIYLDKKSESLKILQQIRDEAHRFGITHHRNKRDKEPIKSVLSDIDGIGYTTAQTLLRKFKSVSNISNTGLSELQKIIGKSKAEIVFRHFHKENNA